MIREAGPADAALLAQLEQASADHPWTEGALRETLALATTRAWIAGDPPAGHLVASLVADEGEVLTLGVAPDARRRGYARALLAACEAAWSLAGVREAFLEVRADNLGAIALYRAAGWAPCGRRARYYADGADALLLRRALDP